LQPSRYETIDLARGIALLGVALVNVHAIARGWANHYALDLAAHWGDVVVEYIVATLFTHRSFPLLAFLFGAGISMQWQRTHGNSHDLLGLRARYWALLILGLAHAILLWPGDIVSTYAIIALVMLLKWPKRTTTLARFVVVLAVLAVALYVAAIVGFALSEGNNEPVQLASSFAEASIGAAISAHLGEYFRSGIVQIMLPEVWCAIVAGVWLGQSARFEHWLRGDAPAGVWFRIGFAALALGTALELTASRFGGWQFALPNSRGDAILYAGVPLAIFGSVFAWLALCHAWREDVWPPARNLFLAAGRTPLTQFFGQSLIFAILFNKSLLGWHGEMGRAAYSGVAVTAFVALALFARAWLANGRERGPMETVWMALAKRL
jgi:uncharacterized protein